MSSKSSENSDSEKNEIESTNGEENIDERNCKTRKPEKWEIDCIGEFLFELALKQVISIRSDWLVLKETVIHEFNKFLNRSSQNGLREKLENIYGKSIKIGTLMYRCGYLKNTKRGSDYYQIKFYAFFEYRNKKLNMLDNEHIQLAKQQTSLNRSSNHVLGDDDDDDDDDDDGVDDVDDETFVFLNVDVSSPKLIPGNYDLEYQGSQLQLRDNDFFQQTADRSCYICQKNIVNFHEYKKHLALHNQETDFNYLLSLEKFNTPLLKLSYSFCEDAPVYCFSIKTDSMNVIIEKIILVLPNKMHFVENERTPFELSSTGNNFFFINAELITKYIEYPMILIFHDKTETKSRILEEHHFVVIKDFPNNNKTIESACVSNDINFKTEFPLSVYAPKMKMRAAINSENLTEDLNEISHEFNDYIKNGKKLTLSNMSQALNILLQMEDLEILNKYYNLVQRHIKLRDYLDQRVFVFKLKGGKTNNSENFPSSNDEILLIPEGAETFSFKEEVLWDLLTSSKEHFIGANNKEIKPILGEIKFIFSGCVTFITEQPIEKNKSYLIIIRPRRLYLRYQYRAIETLGTMTVADINRLLFPQFIAPTELASKSLQLYHEFIAKDSEQLQAIKNIVEGPHKDAPYIVCGPAGTGKTLIIVESILQLYKNRDDAKILVTAGSNSTCDEIALKLYKFLSKVVEPNALIRIYDSKDNLQYEKIDKLLLEFSNFNNKMQNDYPIVNALQEYRIIICTLSVVGDLTSGKYFENQKGNGIFTHIFIDDATSLTEAETLIGVLGNLAPQGNLIISGDDRQLTPKLHSSKATEFGLDVSLISRLLTRDCYKINNTIKSCLKHNYRTHPDIVEIFNKLFYENNKLNAAADVPNLCERWHRVKNPDYPIVFHTVLGTTMREKNTKALYNIREIDMVMDYVKDLLYIGINGQKISQQDIGIITLYQLQGQLIQAELDLRKLHQIELGGVEKFQSKEKPIIIVSFVCSFTPNVDLCINSKVSVEKF